MALRMAIAALVATSSLRTTVAASLLLGTFASAVSARLEFLLLPSKERRLGLLFMRGYG